MAKSAGKPAAKAAAKATAKTPKKAVEKKSTAIDRVCEEALAKLRELGIQEQLQNDIEWCLGSYRADGNPVGLYAMAERALYVFQEEKARKTKGITAKLISDIEKSIESR